MISPIEATILRHGILMTFQGQPVLPPFVPGSDAPREPVAPDPWTAYAARQTAEVEGLADVYKLLVTISGPRRVIDGKQLGVLPGFVFDQATVTIEGVAYRVSNYMPRSFGHRTDGYDLDIAR